MKFFSVIAGAIAKKKYSTT